MNKLRECPACHKNSVSRNSYVVESWGQVKTIECDVCGFMVMAKIEELATRTWNTRNPDPRLKEAIDKINFEISDNVPLPKDIELGLTRAKRILERYVPELKEVDDGN